MPGALKILVIVVVLVILTVAGLLGYVMFAIDPNDYKPQIEQAANKRDLDLEIQGDLGWSLFPNLGLEIGAVQLASDTHRIRPSSLQSAQLSLALMPLLQKQVIIKALSINGADIHLEQADRGATVAAPAAATTEISQEQSGLPFSLAVDKLELNDSKVTLYNPDGSATVIDHISLSSLGLSASGEPAPLSLTLQYPVGERQVTFSAEGEVGYAQSSGQVSIPVLELRVENLIEEPVSLTIAGEADLKADNAAIRLFDGDLAGIAFKGNFSATQLSSDSALQGDLEIASDNLKKALEAITGSAIATSDSNALKTLKLTAGFSGSTERITLKPLNLELDDTSINGGGTLDLEETINLQLALNGNDLNIDRYRGPPAEDAEPTGPTVEGNQALLAPVAGTVGLVAGGKASIDITFDSLTIAETELANPKAAIRVDGDRVSLSPLEFGAYDGKVNATVAVNTAGQPPAITFSLAVANIDIARAQKQWSENADLSGRLTMNMQGSTRGETTEQLMNQLAANGNLAADDLHLASVNLEQSYCEIAQLIERNPPREAPWPEGTNFDDLASQFTIKGQTIRLQNYVTGVGNLKARGQGTIDLDRETFDVDVIANLQGDRTSEDGCEIKSKRIRNRDIPLNCKDSFADAGPGSCKPDRDFVEDAFKGEVLDRLLPESEDGDEKPLEGLLRGLLNR